MKQEKSQIQKLCPTQQLSPTPAIKLEATLKFMQKPQCWLTYVLKNPKKTKALWSKKEINKEKEKD